MDRQKVFAERLHLLRTDEAMTQTELGRLIGATKIQISRYENGETFPVVETAAKIADLFGVTLDYLVGRSNVPRPGIWYEADLTDDEQRLIRATREVDVASSLIVLAAVLKEADTRKLQYLLRVAKANSAPGWTSPVTNESEESIDF